jgi:hypothetical protein
MVALHGSRSLPYHLGLRHPFSICTRY